MAQANMATLVHGPTLQIVGLDTNQSQAILVAVILASACLGALGWEMLISMPFDLKLARQTRWRSIPSTIHSFSYYLSRFATLAFVVIFVSINTTASSTTHDDVCQARVTAAAALFVISECSVLLVFMMRAIALWNMDWRVVTLLSIGWSVTLGLGSTIPAKGKGFIYGGFCTWQIPGAYVGISMVTTAVTCALCLVTTLIKLNKHGWTGLWHNLKPSTSRSIDAEEVGRLLLQRTTVFFLIVILAIVIGDVVYFTQDFFAWKLLGVPVYLTLACNLAGRIFRRSWELTRSTEYNRPPSYFPNAWRGKEGQGQDADPFRRDRIYRAPHGANRSGALSQPSLADMTSTEAADYPQLYKTDPYHYHRFQNYQMNDPSLFVEGEFRAPNPAAGISMRSLVPPSMKLGSDGQTTAADDANERSIHRRISNASVQNRGTSAHGVSDDVIVPVYEEEGGEADVSQSKDTTAHDGITGVIAAAPAFVPKALRSLGLRAKLVSRGSLSTADTNRDAVSPPPFDSHGKTGYPLSCRTGPPRPVTEPVLDGTTKPRRHTEADVGRHARQAHPKAIPSQPTLGSPESPRPETISSGTTGESQGSPKQQYHEAPHWSSFDLRAFDARQRASSEIDTTGGAVSPLQKRDDLASVPERTRLWLDSSAERSRMEAMVGPTEIIPEDSTLLQVVKPGNGKHIPASLRTSTNATTIGGSRRSTTAKHSILEHASEAGQNLSAIPTRPILAQRRTGSLGADDKAPLTAIDERRPSERSAFLASPAIISRPGSRDVWSDRSKFDFDEMRRSLFANAPMRNVARSPSWIVAETGNGGNRKGIPTSGSMSSHLHHRNSVQGYFASQTRPRSASVRLHNSRVDPLMEEEDPMQAFRQAVDEDISRSSRRTSVNSSFFAASVTDASTAPTAIHELRPRTSRGSLTSMNAPLPGRFPLTHERDRAASQERPKTRVADQGRVVRPFGQGLADSAPILEHRQRMTRRSAPEVFEDASEHMSVGSPKLNFDLVSGTLQRVV